MNHALFYCYLSCGILPAEPLLCNLCQSLVTHSYRLYPAMLTLKYGQKLIKQKSFSSLLSVFHFISVATCLSPQIQLFCSGETHATLIQNMGSKTKLYLISMLAWPPLLIPAIWLNGTIHMLSTPGMICTAMTMISINLYKRTTVILKMSNIATWINPELKSRRLAYFCCWKKKKKK